MENKSEEEPMENWKQFHGTELGGLLGKIYGNDNKPLINYPKLKTKPKAADPQAPFLPCGKPGAVDARKATKREVNVNVPQVGKSKRQSYSAIDCVARRRNESVIKTELDEISLRNSHYRPAHTRAISTEAEKEKYSQICSFKGGKGLPAELTQPVGEAPFEAEAKRKEAERMSKLRAKYRGNESKPVPRELSHAEQMEVQLTQEINERCDYLDTMKEIGISPSEVTKIKSEINQRVAELKRLTNST
jgi:hypothetical protein